MNDTVTENMPSGRPAAMVSSHPSPEAWVSYYAGELPDGERQDLQGHLTRCRRCVDLVLDLDAFSEPAGADRTGVSSFEKAAVWRALESARRPAYRWAAAAALAASLAFATLGLASWKGQQQAIGDLEAHVAELSRIESVAIVHLDPGVRHRGVDAAGEATVLLAGTDKNVLVLNPLEVVEHADYELRIQDAGGVEVERVGELTMTEVGNFIIAIPPGALASGSYELRLFGLDGEREALVESFRVRVD